MLGLNEMPYDDENDDNEDEIADLIIERSNICPHCHQGMVPKHISYSGVTDPGVDKFFSLLQCPVCKNHYVVVWTIEYDGMMQNSYAVVWNTYPKIDTAPANFSDYVKDVSPKFIKIYNEAIKARDYNLNEIAGVGFRKSLEFLVKDYCIKNNPNSESKVASATLGQVIETFISNERIKRIAKAATWIGNDETHYIRKHESYDIEHLIKFINLMVRHIDDEVLYEDIEQLTNKK